MPASAPDIRCNLGFRVDVGGSGTKGGIVDLDTGLLVGERFQGLTPGQLTRCSRGAVAEVVAHFDWQGPVGVTLPGVVSGCDAPLPTSTRSWIGTDVYPTCSADISAAARSPHSTTPTPAGLAEDRSGAGRDVTGVVMLLTFGTGIRVAHGRWHAGTEYQRLGHLTVRRQGGRGIRRPRR